MEVTNATEKVKEVVKLAATKVPFYKHLYAPFRDKTVQFEELPLVTKDDLATTNLVYMNKEALRDPARQGKLMMGYSSGTTGKMTKIMYDEDDHVRSLQELWFYRLKWYGIKAGKDKLLTFYPTADEKLNVGKNKTQLALSKSFLLSDENIRQALAIIEDFKPDYTIIQPSVGIVLYDSWEKLKINPIKCIRYIEFNGEFLEPTVEDKMKEIFPNAAIANQYGLQEVQSVAFTCPQGHMHLMSNNCYTEIANKDKKGIGDICITSLKNPVMPYVRFVTGDKGFITDEKCSCGCKNPILYLTRGRDNDFIRRPNGKKLHPYTLLQLIEKLNKTLIQYRITQTDYNDFTFELVIKSNFDKRIIETIIKTYMEKTYLKCKVNCTFVYSDKLLPERKTGKQTVFICTMRDK
jgi:phenylacetate-CoA ligase